jgi:hypothetical protein
MDRVKNFADVETPVPGVEWTAIDERKRMNKILDKLRDSPFHDSSKIEVLTAKVDGQVIFHLKQALPANQRGPLLLNLEDYLKRTIDESLTVWLEPLGDRSSLRNLRGIEVKHV